MENFGLFDLFNKILSTKTQNVTTYNADTDKTKKDKSISQPSPLPSYYTQTIIVNLIKQHEKLSKEIDKSNKKN